MGYETLILMVGFGLGAISHPIILRSLKFAIEFQIKIFSRQCRIDYIMATRYKDKIPMGYFKRGGTKKSDTVGFSIDFSTFLGVLFTALKATNVIHWSWIWVLSPFWIPWATLIVAGIIGLFVLLVCYLIF